MTQHEITYGKHKIQYTLSRKKVKNINLSLKPDLIVEVSASHDVPIEKIHSFVKRKASWIVKNKEYFKRSLSEIKYKKEYVNGETLKYLGRQYRLKVFQSNKEYVKCKRGYLNLYVKDKKDIARKIQLIDDWYKKKSIKIFNESLERVYRPIKKYNIPKPNITIRTMKARWGSCVEPKNKIIINSELINAPKFCIDYVILHELIHFKFRDHNKNFYKLQNTLMPDWKKRKEILDIEIVKNL
jgi:predicted metal-dependent hydrolase